MRIAVWYVLLSLLLITGCAPTISGVKVTDKNHLDTKHGDIVAGNATDKEAKKICPVIWQAANAPDSSREVERVTAIFGGYLRIAMFETYFAEGKESYVIYLPDELPKGMPRYFYRHMRLRNPFYSGIPEVVTFTCRNKLGPMTIHWQPV